MWHNKSTISATPGQGVAEGKECRVRVSEKGGREMLAPAAIAISHFTQFAILVINQWAINSQRHAIVEIVGSYNGSSNNNNHSTILLLANGAKKHQLKRKTRIAKKRTTSNGYQNMLLFIQIFSTFTTKNRPSSNDGQAPYPSQFSDWNTILTL